MKSKQSATAKYNMRIFMGCTLLAAPFMVILVGAGGENVVR
jgi:hypothetical protein